MSEVQNSTSPTTPRISKMSTLFGRIMWSGLGPILLLGLGLSIAMRGGGWFTLLDLLFGIVVLLMLWGRTVEHRSGEATTMTGEVASSQEYVRYMRMSIPIAILLWACANVLGNHVLN